MKGIFMKNTAVTIATTALLLTNSLALSTTHKYTTTTHHKSAKKPTPKVKPEKKPKFSILLHINKATIKKKGVYQMRVKEIDIRSVVTFSGPKFSKVTNITSNALRALWVAHKGDFTAQPHAAILSVTGLRTLPVSVTGFEVNENAVTISFSAKQTIKNSAYKGIDLSISGALCPDHINRSLYLRLGGPI
jgi:hypothetical protein